MSRIAVVSFFFILTIALILRILSHLGSSHKYLGGEVLDKEITIFSDPRVSGRIQRMVFSLDSGQTVLLTLPKASEISYGDTIRVRGELESRKIGENEILALNYPQLAVKKSDESWFLAILADVRYEIAEFFSRNLPQTSSSLLMGIVFGIRDNIPRDFSDLLEKTGVTHVVAASGMNITLIAGIFSVSFGRIFRRRTALILTLCAIFFYAFLSGLSPSIVRASIMGSLIFSSQIMGRQNVSLIALFLTCFVMLFISPKLIFDISFQLSVMATMGIITLNPFFLNKLKTNKALGRLPAGRQIFGENLITTISAQAGTIPIILSNFGTYSVLSVLVNLLILWTVPTLMVLGALAALLAFVFEPLAVLILYASFPFLYYFETVVKTLGLIDASLQLQNFPWQLSLGYYLLLLSFIVKIKR